MMGTMHCCLVKGQGIRYSFQCLQSHVVLVTDFLITYNITDEDSQIKHSSVYTYCTNITVNIMEG
jgi:hypothetical protein